MIGTKKEIYNIVGILILAMSILAYILVRATWDFEFRFVTGEDDGLRFLLPLLVAEYEILVSIRYFVFERNGNSRQAKIKRTGMICGFVLLMSVLFQPLVYALYAIVHIPWTELYFVGGFVLCEPLQCGIMLLLGIRHFVNARRERLGNMEETTRVQHSVVCGILNAIAMVVLIIASIQYMLVTTANLLMFLFWIS